MLSDFLRSDFGLLGELSACGFQDVVKCKQSTKGGKKRVSGEVTDTNFVMEQLLDKSKKCLIPFNPVLKFVSYMVRWAVQVKIIIIH